LSFEFWVFSNPKPKTQNSNLSADRQAQNLFDTMSASTRVAGRYAKSLIDLASERGNLQSVVGDMEHLNEAMKNRDLYLMLKSPIINSDKKESIMKILFAESFDNVTMSFINICIAKNREDILPEIASDFLDEYKKMQGITTIKVTTATPLSTESLEELRTKLLASAATAKNVEIETAVNPDLIGGYVVEFGDKLYDASISHKLETLKKEFKSNIYESQIEKK
jgi:F-type H+-transporting ATPase subunit delta